MDTPSPAPVERMAYSQLTKTPVPYKGRWKNPIFKNEYLKYWRDNVKKDWKEGVERKVKRTSVIPQPPRNPPNQEVCELCNISYPEWRRPLHRASNLHKTRMLEHFVERYQMVGFDKLCEVVDELLIKNDVDATGVQPPASQLECEV